MIRRVLAATCVVVGLATLATAGSVAEFGPSHAQVTTADGGHWCC
jgi:hypothetical protein